MNDQQTVAHALRCLQIIDNHPAPSQEIIQAIGLPPILCTRLLQRLQQAGLISANAEGCFLLERALDDLSPFEILDAVWETFLDGVSIEMWFGDAHGVQAEHTQKAVALAQRTNLYVSDGSLS